MPLYDCCLCERPFLFGPHKYDGRKLPGWGDLMVCNVCDHSNRDGVVLEKREHLQKHLKELGIKPELNDQGRTVLPSRLL